jgi:hypothetical protein
MATADYSWRLLQLAELTRAIERHEDRVLIILNNVEPGARATFACTISRHHIEALHNSVAEMTQLIGQAEMLIDSIPSEPILITCQDLRAEAERVLSQSGTLDAGTVLLAAQLLDRTRGLRALANALHINDARTAWDGTTVGRLLTAFRGVTPHLVRRIAASAGLHA